MNFREDLVAFLYSDIPYSFFFFPSFVAQKFLLLLLLFKILVLTATAWKAV